MDVIAVISGVRTIVHIYNADNVRYLCIMYKYT